MGFLRSNQGHQLVSGVGRAPGRQPPQVKVMVNESSQQAQMPGEGMADAGCSPFDSL